MIGLQSRSPQLVFPLGQTACLDCPYGKISRCVGPTTIESYSMIGDSIVGCLDNQRQEEFYNSLLNLNIPAQKANQEKLFLPSYIPLITDGLSQVLEYNSDPLYAISLETLLYNSGNLTVKSSQHLRKKLGLSPDARIGLMGGVQDKKLERFWTVSWERELWRYIVDLDFEFVTSCTFSVWYDHPRFDQIYNQQRNRLTHDLIASFGVPSIPFIMFSDDEIDNQENISWLNDRPDITVIAMRGQNRRTKGEFRGLLDEMQIISERVNRPLHFLIAGCSEHHRIESILNAFDATIVEGHAFQSGIHGEQILPNLRSATDLDTTPNQLVLNNILQYDRLCEATHCTRKGLLFRL